MWTVLMVEPRLAGMPAAASWPTSSDARCQSRGSDRATWTVLRVESLRTPTLFRAPLDSRSLESGAPSSRLCSTVDICRRQGAFKLG